MLRPKLLLLFGLGLGLLVLAAALPTFVINGKTVKVDTLEKGGKYYVEVQGFAKALGVSLTYDKAKNQFVIVSVGQAAQTQVAGTAQLAGGEGEFGKTYTLGKSSPLNFTLRSAEYTVSRVTMGTSVYAPEANEKLLVLHYTVQNPTQRDRWVNRNSFRFTVVDAKDFNHVFDNYVAREGTTEIYEVDLKPAQKVDLVAAWAVPASGVMPKLIVERERGAPVLRYDLRGKVKPLPAPFADPTDPSGATALEEVPARAGTYYPMLKFDMRLESVSYSTEPMDKRPPAEGKRYLVATFAIKNACAPTAREANFSYSYFKFELKDTDGEKQEFDGYLIKAARDEHADGKLKPGEEYKFRIYFELPQEVKGQTLYAAEGKSRVYAFDLSQFQ